VRKLAYIIVIKIILKIINHSLNIKMHFLDIFCMFLKSSPRLGVKRGSLFFDFIVELEHLPTLLRDVKWPKHLLIFYLEYI